MEDNINNNQNPQQINSNSGLSSFPPEQATPSSPSSQYTDRSSNNVSNIVNKDIVTRPLLWGIVVFLVFFALVIGAVSVYRMYQTDDMVEETIPMPEMCGDGGVGCALPPMDDPIETTPVSDNTNIEADLIESEIQSIDSDLEEDIYSDEALGL
ncbi:MAG: hypothetical protein RJB24_211 [Candidatus Parcubacteria bacterium]|jgi:hypothetical protein